MRLTRLIDNMLKFIYEHSTSLFYIVSIILMIYALMIMSVIVLCVCVALVLFATMSCIRYENTIEKNKKTDQKLDVYTLELKKSEVEEKLPVPIRE